MRFKYKHLQFFMQFRRFTRHNNENKVTYKLELVEHNFLHVSWDVFVIMNFIFNFMVQLTVI